MEDSNNDEDNDANTFFPENIEVDFDNLDDGHLDYYFNEPCEDYTEYFTTNETFSSLEEIVEWTKKLGRNFQMFLVIGHSNKSTYNRRGRVTLQCERSGKPQNNAIKSNSLM